MFPITSQGIGVFALDPVGKREVVLSVPFRLCISVESIMVSHLKVIFEDNPDLLQYPDEVMAIAIMNAIDDPTSTWYSHVQTMPDSFNTPLFWSATDVEYLKGSIVYHLVGMMRKRMTADWESIHEPISRNYPQFLGSANIDKYMWTMSAIYSRAVDIIRHSAPARCIPPLIDMGNHNPHDVDDSIESLLYLDKSDTVCIVNSTEKSRGEEIYVMYGHYPNSKLLYSYGFVVDGNPYRAIDLWPRLPSSCVKAAEKQQLLRSHPLTAEQTFDFKGTIRDKYISPALLTTVRVISATEEEMESGIDRAFRGEIISPRNELESYNSLLNLIIARMQVDNAEVLFRIIIIIITFLIE